MKRFIVFLVMLSFIIASSIQSFALPLGQYSIDGPDIIYYNGKMYIAWAGTDNPKYPHYVNFMSSTNGGKTFGLHGVLPWAETRSKPSLAQANGKFFIAYTELDGAISITWNDDTYMNFSYKYTIPDEYALQGTSPSIASSGNTLFLAWTGTDKRLNTLSMDVSQCNKRIFSVYSKTTLYEYSNYGPSISFGAATLCLAWTDYNKRINVMTKNVNYSTWTNKNVLNEYAKRSPTCKFKYRLISSGNFQLCWTGTDNCLNSVVSLDGLSYTGKKTSDQTSYYAPSVWPLIYSNNSNYSAYYVWTGTDSQLNFSSTF
ncbi:hypothetical protein [Pseudobacteroides cellulosolvens]|uniref:Glycoside hydrolase family 43 n=1 Tax=Pseudobacteroides cellulosolvens ATCC 35603 = DSM 2933 TaxID=398512 RepID=A0A0L6JIK7_9FIRM|nr:hypothetical protein [Pseudobacteroides cellulosolvens]KNY25574.1 hypothetical protein Bccel_0834 [Pseudobacteroides cellulosolvens ATCC 35603 = DSM 2933]